MEYRIRKNPETGQIETIGTPIETITGLNDLVMDEKNIKPTDVLTKGMWNYLLYDLIALKEKVRQLEKKLEGDKNAGPKPASGGNLPNKGKNCQ